VRSGSGIDTLLTWDYGALKLMDSKVRHVAVGKRPTAWLTLDEALKRPTSRNEAGNVTLR